MSSCVDKASHRLDEFALIERYFKDLTPQVGVCLGIGDDAAIVECSADSQLVIATDTLLESVHFPADTNAYDIGRRALCVNLSDLAAMGAKPRWFTLALSLPSRLATEAWFDSLSRGLADIAASAGCALVGGDTTRGPLSVTLTLLGEVPVAQALRRDGAMAGDYIYVTGTLGDGAAALHVLKNESKRTQQSRLLEHFYAPKPRVSEGIQLRGIASACIDISDGLLADLAHICKLSRVGAEIQRAQLPVHPELRRDFLQQHQHWALYGGDDYQLCFTVPPDRQPHVEKLISAQRLQATAIGTITASKGMDLLDIDGGCEPIGMAEHTLGYNHFE